jgi:hypothetical protein
MVAGHRQIRPLRWGPACTEPHPDVVGQLPRLDGRQLKLCVRLHPRACRVCELHQRRHRDLHLGLHLARPPVALLLRPLRHAAQLACLHHDCAHTAQPVKQQARLCQGGLEGGATVEQGALQFAAAAAQAPEVVVASPGVKALCCRKTAKESQLLPQGDVGSFVVGPLCIGGTKLWLAGQRSAAQPCQRRACLPCGPHLTCHWHDIRLSCPAIHLDELSLAQDVVACCVGCHGRVNNSQKELGGAAALGLGRESIEKMTRALLPVPLKVTQRIFDSTDQGCLIHCLPAASRECTTSATSTACAVPLCQRPLDG